MGIVSHLRFSAQLLSMRMAISDKSVSLIVEGLQRLDDYMKANGVSYTERIPFLNVKSRVGYLLKQERRRLDKIKRRKEKV